MVTPAVITITADLVGLNRMDLPQFSGYDVLVQVSVIGTLNETAVDILDTGGFELKGSKTFQLDEVYTVIPVQKALSGIATAPLYPFSQYPHTMVLTTVSGSVRVNGNWQPGTTSTTEKPCRAEPNSKNAFIIAADGTQVYFDYTVFMPLPADTVAPGTTIEVYGGDELLSKSTVKRFSRGQLNARLWL